jgi:ABC transporter with metal-binding/Fe-S-binding domain ATP-binding protein
MNIAVLFSGGKDSCLALHKSLQEGHKVKYLLTILPETQESFMFHTPYDLLLKKQAEMLGIELITVKSKAEKEKELLDLEKLLKKVVGKVDAITVGGIASNYQGDRVKKICDKLKFKFYAPLWGYSSEKIWEELLNNNFKVIITKIACEGIGQEFLGKVIDNKIYENLLNLSKKYKFRIDFEGGEAETAVLGMPDFKKDIKIEFESIKEGEYNSIIKLKKVF